MNQQLAAEPLSPSVAYLDLDIHLGRQMEEAIPRKTRRMHELPNFDEFPDILGGLQ